jgi:hypothetical protein
LLVLSASLSAAKPERKPYQIADSGLEFRLEGSNVRRAVAAAVGGVCLISVLALAVALHESATIVLGIPAQRVQAHVTMTGGQAEGDLRTRMLSVKVTDTAAGTATPATVGDTFATGDVVFTYFSACTRECGGIAIRVPPGSDLATAAGIHYVTLDDEWLPRTASVPLPVATSKPVPVRAVLPGKSGNTGAGTILKFGYNQAPGLVVTNPKPINGGSDRATHIVSQSDHDTVERAAASEAIADVNRAMRTKAIGLGYALVGPPTLEEVTSDPVGAETQSFTVSVTATLQAVAFFDSAFRSLLTYDVLARVGAGQELTGDSIETDYGLETTGSDGEVRVVGTATAFVVPKLATQELQWRLAGLDVGRARDLLGQTVPDAKVSIQTWPSGAGWLPSVPDDILIQVQALPAPA